MATVHLLSPRGPRPQIPSFDEEKNQETRQKVEEVEAKWKERLEECYATLKNPDLDPSSRSERLREAAELLLKQKNPDFSAVSQHLQEALQILSNPELKVPRIWYRKSVLYKLLASSCIKQKKYQEALEHYQRGWKVGIREGKEDYNAFLTVEYAKFLLQCRRDYEKYQNTWDLCSPPEYAEFLKTEGSHLPNPVDVCVQTLERCPEAIDLSGVLLHSLRHDATQAKDGDAAQKHWKTLGSAAINCSKMATTDSFQIEIRKFLAESYIFFHQYPEALRVLEEAIRLDPSPKNVAELSRLLLEVRILDFPYDDHKMLTHALRLVDKKPEAALELFETAKRFYFHHLKPTEQIETLLGSARAVYFCLKQKRPVKRSFKFARARLEEAKRFLEEKTIPPKKKGDIFHLSLLLCLQENPSAEVESLFQEGIGVYRAHEPLLLDYIQLLIERDRLEEAFSLWKEKSDETFLGDEHGTYLHAKICIAQARKEKTEAARDKAKAACTKALRFARDEAKTVELYDLLAETHLQEEEKQEAYRCKLEAYRLDKSPIRSVERFKELTLLDAQIEEKDEAAPKGVPQKSREELLQMIVDFSKEDPEQALQMCESFFQPILDAVNASQSKETFYLECFQVLMEYGKTLLEISSDRSWLFAQPKFQQALSFLKQRPQVFENLPPQERSRLHFSLARIYAKRGEEDALTEFDKAWSLYKADKDLLFAYFRFLIDRQELEKAGKILDEVREKIHRVDFDLLEAEYFLACGKLKDVEKKCINICATMRSVSSYSPIVYPLVEIHSFTAKACLGMERFLGAEAHAKSACDYAKPEDYLNHFQKYSQAFRANIEERHLEELMNRVEGEGFVIDEKIEYLSHLLTYYEKELMTHVTKHINIFLLRGYWQARAKKYEQARGDSRKALQILEINKSRIHPTSLEKVSVEILKQNRSFIRRESPKKPYQIASGAILFSR